MESAFRGFDGQLIETLGWDGADFVRLPLHLARLSEAAARFGWRCDTAQAEAALRAAAPGHPARMRLSLDACAKFVAAAALLPATRPEWRVGLASARLSSADPWLTVKSTNRATYDAARAALPEGLEEALFLNERDEVCDGTITTLFFDTGDGLCTPPLSSGLLPGVLRADLLAKDRCREAVLKACDLPDARLWVGNSLRGLIPARWSA